jgi:hypothetical protein
MHTDCPSDICEGEQINVRQWYDSYKNESMCDVVLTLLLLNCTRGWHAEESSYRIRANAFGNALRGTLGRQVVAAALVKIGTADTMANA